MLILFFVVCHLAYLFPYLAADMLNYFFFVWRAYCYSCFRLSLVYLTLLSITCFVVAVPVICPFGVDFAAVIFCFVICWRKMYVVLVQFLVILRGFVFCSNA